MHGTLGGHFDISNSGLIKALVSKNADPSVFDLSTQELIDYIRNSNIDFGYSLYSVEKAGSSYTFALKDGYYISGNTNISASYSLCKLTLKGKGKYKFSLECINYAENNYDYGIISNLNQTLSSSNEADSTYLKSFKGLSSPSVQTVDLGSTDGFYTIKYRKDGSSNSYNDSLKFKVIATLIE